jgi:hypothetical protein
MSFTSLGMNYWENKVVVHVMCSTSLNRDIKHACNWHFANELGNSIAFYVNYIETKENEEDQN